MTIPATMTVKPKAEPVEDVSFEDFSFGLDAEADALEAEWDALDADLGKSSTYQIIPNLSSSHKRSNSDLSHLQPHTHTRQQRRAFTDAIPVPNGDYRIFTVQVSAYLRKEKSSGLAMFSVFDMHCVFAGAARWGNTWVPRVGGSPSKGI
jgi:hypothetical protein